MSTLSGLSNQAAERSGRDEGGIDDMDSPIYSYKWNINRERGMAPPVGSNRANVVGADPGQPYGKSLALLASLFFMWGFITVINNTLLPHLRSVFALNYTQTTLIGSVWFIA